MAESQPLLGEKMEIPLPQFTKAKDGKPQAIAHRGYKAANPENTMGAFKGAVEVGAHAIETDLHLSKDGVVVLSHDPTLKRCYGKDEKIADCDWEYLKTLRTLQEPHQPMPRFKDLLEYLATPGLEDIWVLLDVKVAVPAPGKLLKMNRVDLRRKFEDDASELFKGIAATLLEVKPLPARAWNQRVLVGCWALNSLPICTKYLPGYPIAHIGFNTTYARQFLKVPGVSFNMFQKLLVGPCGKAFLRDVREANRSIFLWTVNEESWMKWSIRKGVDGVITDDPKKYLEVRDSYEGEKIHQPLKTWAAILWINIVAWIFSLLFRYKFGFTIDIKKLKKSLEGSTARALV